MCPPCCCFLQGRKGGIFTKRGCCMEVYCGGSWPRPRPGPYNRVRRHAAIPLCCRPTITTAQGLTVVVYSTKVRECRQTIIRLASVLAVVHPTQDRQRGSNECPDLCAQSEPSSLRPFSQSFTMPSTHACMPTSTNTLSRTRAHTPPSV